jgi:hypothetical protein
VVACTVLLSADVLTQASASASVSSTSTDVSAKVNRPYPNIPSATIPTMKIDVPPSLNPSSSPMTPVTVGINLGTRALSARSKQPLTINERLWKLFTWLLGNIRNGTNTRNTGRFQRQLLRNWKSEGQISAVMTIFSQLAQFALVVLVDLCLGQAKWSFLQNNQRSVEVERYNEAMRGPGGRLLFLALILVPRSVRGFKRAQLQVVE